MKQNPIEACDQFRPASIWFFRGTPQKEPQLSIAVLSDFPETYTPALWHLAFPDRSNSKVRDVSGISQLPREFFPSVRVVLDSVEAGSDSPMSFDPTIAFPLTQQGRPSQKADFGAQYTARTFPCERFDCTVAHTDASLGPKATG
jgi:hypothetical protein